MTLPSEMFNSLRSARMFMCALMDPAMTPKVPKEIRSRARDRLKHFPSEFDINQLEEMYNTSHTDKNVIVGQTNKELRSVAGEIAIAGKRLNEVTDALQQFINKP